EAVARAPTQPLATEWAAKNPPVNTTRPTRIDTRSSGSIAHSPTALIAIPVTSTRVRPQRSAAHPPMAAGTVPAAGPRQHSAADAGGTSSGGALNRKLSTLYTVTNEPMPSAATR